MCRSLYTQVMLTIKRGELQQYVRHPPHQPLTTTKIDPASAEKGKAPSVPAEATLRIVPVIIGKPKLIEEPKKQPKIENRILEMVKRLKSLYHGVHHISSGSTFFPTTSITFTQ